MAKPRVRPVQRLQRVIREELLEPRTVFVTESENFAEDWKVFRKVMRSLPSSVVRSSKDKKKRTRVPIGIK